MIRSVKRANTGQSSPGEASKRRKGGDKWRKQQQQSGKTIIESGDWGVLVTCDMGRERKCVAEALDLFSQQIDDATDEIKDGEEDEPSEDDIATQIKKEVEGLKPSSEKPRRFRAIRMDIPCVSFIRFDKSIDPVQLVHELCVAANANPERKRSRWIQRMIPLSSVKKTLSVEIEEFAREILKPHFHAGGPPRKYAIRPTVRNNNKYTRDIIIKTVADVVGPGHPVDLKNYDLLIIVEVIQNIIGMSVVGSDYDKLKRFNLTEIYDPTPKLPLPKQAVSKS